MARKQPLSSIQQMLKPQFRISRSYFIPVDDAPIIPSDVHMVTLDLAGVPAPSSNTWDPDDFLIIPLEDNQGATLGLLSVDAPRDGLRPDLATHARYNRMLLGRLPATRGNRVRMSLNYILTAVFYFMAVNFYFLPALLAFLAWLPLLVWVLRASLAARAARAG